MVVNTDTAENKMREEFERWFFECAGNNAAARNADGEYKYMPASQAWLAWKAGAKNERVQCEMICKSQTEGFCHNSIWDEAALCCAEHILMRSHE